MTTALIVIGAVLTTAISFLIGFMFGRIDSLGDV